MFLQPLRAWPAFDPPAIGRVGPGPGGPPGPVPRQPFPPVSLNPIRPESLSITRQLSNSLPFVAPLPPPFLPSSLPIQSPRELLDRNRPLFLRALPKELHELRAATQLRHL